MIADPADDTRLTAYILGELTGEERAAVEELIASDAAVRSEVQHLRSLALGLRDELRREAAPPVLSAAQRAAIAAAARPRRHLRWPGLAAAGTGLAAAGLVLGVAMSSRAADPAAVPLTAPVPSVAAPLALATVPAVAPTIPPPGTPARQDLVHAVPQEPLALEEVVSASEAEDAAQPVGRQEAVAGSGAPEAGGAFTATGGAGVSIARSGPRTPAPLGGRRGSSGARSAGVRDRGAQMNGARLFLVPAGDAEALPPVGPGGETYNRRADNPFLGVAQEPLSTFSLDVDTASYSNLRRFLAQGVLPPRDAVRSEELVNYFPYHYEPPTDGAPFAIRAEVAPCPWAPGHQLACIGLKAREFSAAARPPANLVFLVDVSGSMAPANRLPLIKTGLSLLATALDARDRVALVTYANDSRIALPPTPGSDHRAILQAIDGLSAGGGTNGGEGIRSAYALAAQGRVAGGSDRVILCTDGDFNVGVTSREELIALIQEQARSRVFLSVMGVGEDNLKDATMELLADRGNGHYAYLDGIDETRKVFLEQMSGTLTTVAKDVKVQVEFNPARIAGYRLIGYEKRALATQDFRDDRKDAGDIGAGHTVTALYELVPRQAAAAPDGLRYQQAPPVPVATGTSHGDELMAVKVRYKAPDSDTSQLLVGTIGDALVRERASGDFAFAAAVAAAGALLRAETPPPRARWDEAIARADAARGDDPLGYRAEFVALLRKAAAIACRPGRE
jgi:secreted protein with Ig-like and vWFA domain/anti-sigma factor RsiW